MSTFRKLHGDYDELVKQVEDEATRSRSEL
jgi:hypothetical protein